MNDSAEIRVGGEVVVGKRFTMDFGMVADEWTGRRMVVVALHPANKYGGGASADLAPAGLLGVDESDAVVSISIGRLVAQ